MCVCAQGLSEIQLAQVDLIEQTTLLIPEVGSEVNWQWLLGMSLRNGAEMNEIFREVLITSKHGAGKHEVIKLHMSASIYLIAHLMPEMSSVTSSMCHPGKR